MQLDDEATEEETNIYVQFWKSRSAKVCKIMDWAYCAAFDPSFVFIDRTGREHQLSLVVVDKLIELNENHG